MSTKINLAFVFHFHQPYGQLKYVLDRILSKCYCNLFMLFEEFESLRFGVHLSGPLLEIMKKDYPSFIDKVKFLLQTKTVELIGGSFSEAILPIIPWDYIPEQIRFFQKMFFKLFNFKPRSFWLPERVWEPYLIPFLSAESIEYVILDDQHLFFSGKKQEDAFYAYLLEENGKTIKAVFANTKIRYLIPWHNPKEAFNYIKSNSSESGDRLLLIISDAEKFGEWTNPDWARKWLREFFKYIIDDESVVMVTPREYLDRYGIRGLAYIPSASYDEMLKWSEGYFKNFFLKYFEANLMHKKMLRVGKIIKENLSDEVLLYYLRGQCNDAYWHGLFGGIYLTNLRQAIYENLIKAERMVSGNKNKVEIMDFDFDGFKEVLIENEYVNVYIKPSDGGSIFEYDIKLENYEHNLVNVMSRYPEPYLIDMRADWHRRTLFREHVFAAETTSKQWIENDPFIDLGNFSLANYKVDYVKNNEVRLSYNGNYKAESNYYPLTIVKSYEVKRLRLLAKYQMLDLENEVAGLNLGIELCITPYISHGQKIPIYIVRNEEKSIFDSYRREDVKSLSIQAIKNLYLKIEYQPNCKLWIEPIYAKARTEKGIMAIPEGLALLALYPLESTSSVVLNLSLQEM